MAASDTLVGNWGATLATGRLSVIDELKGLAIILIVAFHTELSLEVPARSPGFVGVDIFLLLSGFTLGRSSSLNEGAWAFFRRRFSRVLPAYWFVLILFGVVKAGLLDGSIDYKTLLIHACALQAFSAPEHFYATNPSFWFLSLLVLLYPLVYVFRKEQSPYFWITLGLSLGMLVYALAMSFTHDPLRVLFPGRIVSFCLGMALALAVRPGNTAWGSPTLCAVTLVAGFYLDARGIKLLLPSLFGVAVCLGYCAVRGGIAYSPARFGWVAAPFAALGAISYEVFLLHQPLLRFALKAFHWPEDFPHRLASAGLGISVALVGAWCLHAVINRLMSRRSRVQPAPVVVSS
jgi:peptidoglycan/LPS O-acetylase OafA/YrhL